ncbi:MAG: hydantoinase/oxoprolinase family protein [Anaerolineales bacterium]|nr:hydantoinase/oxoprolinase family protein [Anaerolineales bacterium]
MRIGIDIGGTFTDLVLIDDATGAVLVGKALTTPADPARGFLQVLHEALARAGRPLTQARTLVHGTTLVTNALIERSGARTALLATQGHRDMVEIGREQRFDLYDLTLQRPAPLAPRWLRFDVPERILADGSVRDPLDVAFVEALAIELAANDVSAVAICFLNSYLNPLHEQAAAAAIRRAAPGLRITLSAEVAPEIREYERATTGLANAYVQARLEDYLRSLMAELERAGFRGSFLLMQSAGGLAAPETAARFPVRLLESGPAGGVLAAARIAEQAGFSDVLAFDMGGTTAKLSVIEGGVPLVARDFEADRVHRFKRGSGLPIRVPTIDLIEIGAGGGSIARLDTLGLLKVGPESSGADPGPACYGRGGTAPTVTDADLVLGYLDPDFFLGGALALDVAAARAALATLGAQLGQTVEQVAWGIHQVVNQSMANAARRHVLERGQDPRRLPVLAFGGAGPGHATRVAQALGAPGVIVPPAAGALSALGFLVAPPSFEGVRSFPGELARLEWDAVERLLQELADVGDAQLKAAGVEPERITHTRFAELRYLGQGYEISVPVPAAGSTQPLAQLQTAFAAAYQRLYQRPGPPVPIEAVSWRVVSSGASPQLALPRLAGGDPESARKGERAAYFPESGGYQAVSVYDRQRLGVGTRVSGPALIEERESTIVVRPGQLARVDRLGCVILDEDPAMTGDPA